MTLDNLFLSDACPQNRMKHVRQGIKQSTIFGKDRRQSITRKIAGISSRTRVERAYCGIKTLKAACLSVPSGPEAAGFY
jgi:hypothetical protein